MFGLMLAALVAAFVAMKGNDGPNTFKKSTNFLYRWYLIVAVVLTVVLGFMTLMGSAVFGLVAGGLFGGMVGTATGATLVFIIFLVVALGSVFQIVGAKLLHDSLVINQDGSRAWNSLKLGMGIAFLVIGLFILPLKN